MSSVEALIKIVAPVVSGLGYEFWGCELLSAGNSQKLRIYIDNQKGIDVEDCATVSRQVSAVLDVEDPIPGEYVLEVSSPGIDRPLFYIEQYQQYIGENIKLRLKVPQAGRRNFSGRLKAVEGHRISMVLEDQEVTLECDNIGRAKLVPFE
ncbi:MAG: ribosome maturation factor RimP [Gammaproteobacteria bacterium]|nr:ribosome maturation factor RimP [Gammaproteobacteria bacterium]